MQLAAKKPTKGLLCQTVCCVLKCPFVKFIAASFWLAQPCVFQTNLLCLTLLCSPCDSSVRSGAEVMRVYTWKGITSSFFLSNKLRLCYFSSHKTQCVVSMLQKKGKGWKYILKLWKKKLSIWPIGFPLSHIFQFQVKHTDNIQTFL